MMWRRHQLLAQSAVQRWLLPCSSRRRGDAVTTAAARCSYGAGGHQQVFYSTCVNKTSADIFGSSHWHYRIQNVHSNDRTNDYSFQPATSFSTERKGRKLPPRFSDDSTVDELVQIAHDSLDVMTPLATAALWNKISRQVSRRDDRSNNRHRNSDDRQLMERKLNDIFQYTRDGLGTYNIRELTQTIYSLAKIIVVLRMQSKKRGEADHNKRILRQLLMDKNMKPNEELFRFFAGKAMDKLDQFDARGLTNLAYAYAKINYVPDFDDGFDLFDHIAIKAAGKTKEFNAQGISNMVWAYATVNKPHATAGIQHPKLFEKVANHIVGLDSLIRFEPQALSNTVWAYAKADVSHPNLFEKVAYHIVGSDHLNRFDPQNLKDTVWAYATAGVHHPKLFEKVADHIVLLDTLHRFKPQEFSNTVWAYATAGILHPKLFEKMANHIVGSDSLEKFEPQDLKDTVWAYATAGIIHPKLFEKVANHIVGLDSLIRFKPQELSNTVWAYATAAINHPKLFEKVANHIIKLDSLDRFEPQALKDIMWAYATVGISHPKLFERMANHIVGLDSLDRFDPQALSSTLWAYATAGIRHPKLFEKVANHIVRLDSLDRFTHPQDVSNTVWAYAKAGIHQPKLFEKVANHIVKHEELNKFEPQALANTVWAYATAQVSHPKLFHKVAKASIQRKKEFDSQGIANLLWAYATMGIVDKQLFLSFVPTAAKMIDSYTNQGLANIGWAYAVADVDAPVLFNDHFISKCVEKKGGFENEALFQLHQWHLWQTKEYSNPGLPLELQNRCYNTFVSKDPTTSKLQDDVVAQLTSMALDPKEEVIRDNGYRIDAVVEVNGNTVGVEVDGPSHFIGKGKSPTGSTILKRTQVSSIDGMELVSVPYWEWNKLGNDRVKKQDYLRELLGLTTEET